MGKGTRLTALESSFLAMERPGLPLHVAALLVLDGTDPVTMPQLRRLVASRIGRLPKFRQTVDFGALGLLRPEWTNGPRVNLDHHLFHHTLRPPGDRGQLFDLSAQIHERLLDRGRPLWEMHLIDGLRQGRQALLVKTHHAMTDGIGGVEIAEVLLDRARPAAKVETPPTRFVIPGRLSPFKALQSLFGLAFTAGGGPLVLSGPFNGKVGEHRSFAAVSLPMDAILRLKRRLGGSVDDVVVAVVAAALGRYLRQVRYPDIPHALRAMLPVSTRSASGKVGFGNHVTAVFLDLPVESGELAILVPRIASSKAVLRTAHAAQGASMAIEAVGFLPNPLHEGVLRAASTLRFAHLILSDIPGLDEPLFLLGRRITECYPMMPLSGEVGLSIAAISMDGVMGIGVTADPGLVPQPERLARAIEWVLAHHGRTQPKRARGRMQRAA